MSVFGACLEITISILNSTKKKNPSTKKNLPYSTHLPPDLNVLYCIALYITLCYVFF